MTRILLVLLLSTAPICQSHSAPDRKAHNLTTLSLSEISKVAAPENSLKERVEPWFRVKSAKGPSGWIPSHQAWPALSFARYAVVRPSTRLFSGPGVGPIPNALTQERSAAVLSSNPPWYEIQISPHEKAWAEFEDLSPIPHDLGFGYLLRPHRTSTESGPITLQRGTRFHPLAVRGASHVQVKIIDGAHSQKVVWLPRAATLSKLNFAESFELETGFAEAGKLPSGVHKIKKIKTPTRWLMNGRAPVTLHSEPRSDAKVLFDLPPSTPMALVESDWQIWTLKPSMIYGTQWSLKHSAQLPTPESQSQLTSAEVFSRPIFDMSSSPKLAPPMTVLSADGVYLRHGNGPWTKLENFNNLNVPVSITGEGAILVADQISVDYGKTFRSLMAWDQVMGNLPEKTRGEVRPRILKIQTLDHRGWHLLYHLDLGHGNLAVAETKDQGNNWKVRPL